MSMDLENSLIRISRVIHEDVIQSMVEGDIIVTDAKPDVVSVLHVDGEVKVNNKETHKDMVTLHGTVDFKILYMSDDPSRFICSIEHSINFNQLINLPKEDINIKSHVICKVEHIDCTILNGRKLNLKAILNTGAKFIEVAEVPVVSNISGIDNVQVLKKTYNISNNIEQEPIEFILSYEEDIPIGKPAIKEILRTDAYIKNSETKVTGGKAILSGNIEVKSLYVPDMSELPIEFTVNEFPFSEVLDIEELYDSENINVELNLNNIVVWLKQDDDGDTRVLNYEVTVSAKPHFLEKQLFDAVSDAYSVISTLKLQKNIINVSNVVSSAKAQSTIRDFVNLPDDMPLVSQIYNVSYRPLTTSIKIEKDKIQMEGVIETILMYLSDTQDNPFASYAYNMPFNYDLEVKGVVLDMKPEVRVEVDNCIYDIINDREVDLRFMTTIYAKVVNEEFYDVITEVEEVLTDNKSILQPSMMVYYVQSGDTLWDIAKKYLTTINDLIRINQIENPDVLRVGQQLLIPKIVQ